jgi:hypothetical protein
MKLVGAENLGMKEKNEKGNKTFEQNNKWESQMPFAHPPT